jgi:hypothetical protein
MDDTTKLPRPSAYTEAVKRFGLGTIHAMRKESFRVVWAHQWRSLWGWHFDAKEVLAEVVINDQVPDELRHRAMDMLMRDNEMAGGQQSDADTSESLAD